MRNAFVQSVLEEMRSDERIVFMTADLGYNAVESIQKMFPKRFYNVGISEQHLMGMAAGLALEGKRPIAYSIASFSTMRPYEQIRTDICYQNLDVKIIGVGGGYNYASHGVTHHTIEDLAIMRVLPHMLVFSPGYAWEAREATTAMLKHKGPAYIRLGKAPKEQYEKEHFHFQIGKAYEIERGHDIVLCSTGNVLDVAAAAARHIRDTSAYSVGVYSFPSVKPIDKDLLLDVASRARAVFTIEEHSTIGGLGSAVEEALRNGPHVYFDTFGLPADTFLKDVGDRNYMLEKAGLTAESIASQVLSALER